MASFDSIEEKSNTKNEECLKFYPEDNWGLDFYFQTYNKMFICDIVALCEYPMFPGAYSYLNHPIYKVDIIGIIVKVDQNSKCFMYEVDDGTGVICCSCWKVSYSNQYFASVSSDVHHLPKELQDRFKSFDHTEQTEGYSLGNVIHVRGKIRTFREKRQIMASYHSLVRDPLVEVLRMIELPKLYKMKYDRPFELPWKIARKIQTKNTSNPEDGQFSCADIQEMKKRLHDYLKSSDIIEISTSMIVHMDVLLPYLKPITNSEFKTSCVTDILISLENDGILCRRIDNSCFYEVLCSDCDLDKAILHILKEECHKEKYVDKGCHYLHVVDLLHRTYQYSHVKVQCVMYCLEKLELQSDIIRYTKCHYMPINF